MTLWVTSDEIGDRPRVRTRQCRLLYKTGPTRGCCDLHFRLQVDSYHEIPLTLTRQVALLRKASIAVSQTFLLAS